MNNILHILKGLVLLCVCVLSVSAGEYNIMKTIPSSGVDSTVALKDMKVLEEMGYYWCVIRGVSMLPYYGDNSLVGLKKMDFKKIKPRVLVVYHDGVDYVAHRVAATDNKGGWIMQGSNNKHNDPGVLTEANYYGTIVVQLHTNSKITEKTINDNSIVVAYAKTY